MSTKTDEAAVRDFTGVEYWDQLARRSVLRFFLLAALYEQPMHGYGIAGSVATCCEGSRPTDAMIYPALKELQEGGYIACEVEPAGGRTRKVCSLTPKGERAYRAASKAWLNFLPHLVGCISRGPGMSARVMAVLAGCCGPQILSCSPEGRGNEVVDDGPHQVRG
ncbi:MAG: PadR family transcriptional regulator [Gemmatimonadetes bacterium]|nr:PadR family transcriptional regulator [Gemmatimonadota bacterium]